MYEDHDIIVVDKAAELLTGSTYREKEKTAFYLLNNCKKCNYKSMSTVFTVHRLDRETSGVLVFAKTGYIVVKESNNFSLLEINLFTGKKNQIRVYLAEKDRPIMGDKMYSQKFGNNKISIPCRDANY